MCVNLQCILKTKHHNIIHSFVSLPPSSSTSPHLCQGPLHFSLWVAPLCPPTRPRPLTWCVYPSPRPLTGCRGSHGTSTAPHRAPCTAPSVADYPRVLAVNHSHKPRTTCTPLSPLPPAPWGGCRYPARCGLDLRLSPPPSPPSHPHLLPHLPSNLHQL